MTRLFFGVRGCAGADVGVGVVGAPVSCDASGDELRRPVRSRRAAVLNGVSNWRRYAASPLTEFAIQVSDSDDRADFRAPSSAATAAAGSPGCCWGRSAPRWSKPPGHGDRRPAR